MGICTCTPLNDDSLEGKMIQKLTERRQRYKVTSWHIFSIVLKKHCEINALREVNQYTIPSFPIRVLILSVVLYVCIHL